MIAKRKMLLAVVLILLFIAAITLLLCSCKNDNNRLNIRVSSEEKNLIDLAEKIYEQQELTEIRDFDGTINDFNKKYPFQCLRKKENYYRASYLGEREVAVIIFDLYGNKQHGYIQQNDKSKTDFDKLLGSYLGEVRELDPTGDYAFLFMGRDDVPRCSYHCTAEGYSITIEYDNLGKVKGINYELL